MFAPESDGLPHRIEVTDSDDGHLVLVQEYYDYNQDIVIQAPGMATPWLQAVGYRAD